MGAGTALLTLAEGVCDRTGLVRDALRGDLPCAAVSPADLAARRDLDLSSSGLAALREEDLLGLAELRLLDLSGNALEVLSPGLFAGLGRLQALDLRHNPGAPFVVRMGLVRTDDLPWAPAPATVMPWVREGAPFLFAWPLGATGGTLVPSHATISPGEFTGPSLTASASAGTMRIAFAETPEFHPRDCETREGAPCVRGAVAAAGDPLVLFKPPPSLTATLRDRELDSDGDSARVALADLFEAADGGGLHFTAYSNDTAVIRVVIRGGLLIIRSGVSEGHATVTVVATDDDGLASTTTFTVAVTAMGRNPLTGWRRVLLERTRRQPR